MSSASSPRITRILAGSEAAHWQAVIQRCARGEAQTLKEDGGTRVMLLPGLPVGGARGPDLIVKRWELRGFRAQLKSLTHTSRAWRHWRGAARLQRAGVRTAACYAIMQSEDAGVTVEWLIMERLPGNTLLQHMADRDLTARQEHTAARQVAAMIAAMQSRLYNRDGKPSNLIVDQRHGTDMRIGVIDTVGVKRVAAPMIFDGDDEIVSMFANLVIEPVGCGVTPRRSLMMRTVTAYYQATLQDSVESGLPQREARAARRNARNGLWKTVADAIKRHGDPTPKVNPLGGPSAPETGLPLQ